MYFDANTAKFVCQLHGFVGGVATEQGSFRSPDNNNIYRWEPTTKKLLQANAGGSGNRTIKAYSCKGKLKDPCKKDQGWIFQQLPWFWDYSLVFSEFTGLVNAGKISVGDFACNGHYAVATKTVIRGFRSGNQSFRGRNRWLIWSSESEASKTGSLSHQN